MVVATSRLIGQIDLVTASVTSLSGLGYVSGDDADRPTGLPDLSKNGTPSHQSEFIVEGQRRTKNLQLLQVLDT
ncbi:hypothetical protein VTN31DRAFT_3089 [Thermomyces dupontii]|uniref:uncharacterized protein n=1 Tax=Talaromyces thermophilus TaxID=28565 RepID=UPI00374211A2